MTNQGSINRRSFLAGVAGLGAMSLVQTWTSPAMAARSIARLPDRKEVIIRNAYVMTMDSAIGDLTNGDVHIRNGEIVAIGTQVQAPIAETIDGQNMIVLPGLIDTHWHLWTALLRSSSDDGEEQGYFPMTERLGKRYSPEDMYRAAQLATAEALYLVD